MASKMKPGKPEKLSAAVGNVKDAKKSTSVEALGAKAVKAAPKKRGIVAKAAAATCKGRINKKQLLRGKGLKKKNFQRCIIIDCSNVTEDSSIDLRDFKEYVVAHIKIKGKMNNLQQFHAYLKYVTKKYLKKNGLRDWIRVVASDENSYEFRYFMMNSIECEDEDVE